MYLFQLYNEYVEILEGTNANKTLQQSDSNLKTNNGSYSQENNQGDNLDSNTFSEDSKTYFKDTETSHKDNQPSKKEIGLHQPNFITLSKIPEEEQIEIIQNTKRNAE